jgi:hypothetical protein
MARNPALDHAQCLDACTSGLIHFRHPRDFALLVLLTTAVYSFCLLLLSQTSIYYYFRLLNFRLPLCSNGKITLQQFFVKLHSTDFSVLRLQSTTSYFFDFSRLLCWYRYTGLFQAARTPDYYYLNLLFQSTAAV